MYRTDKQFMNNPATASSRIYIGFLPKTVVASDLEEKFKCHGKILGLVLQSGFAFIQYENDSQAQAAIQKENFTMLHGRKITVKQALDKSKNNQNKKNNSGPPQQQQQQQQHQPPPQQPPPLMQSQQQQQQQQQDQRPPPQQQHIEQQKPPPQEAQQHDEPPPLMKGGGGGGGGPPVSPGPNNGSDQMKKFQKKDQQRGIGGGGGGGIGGPGGPGKKRRVRSRERFPQSDMYRDDFYGNAPPIPYNAPPVPAIDQPDRNDCEIIVVSKLLTKYAEYIEQRLKSLGLIVDLLFPNEDVPIGRVLANISSRGCLYAILVMPQNEEHRSLTLNILHGVPQEHRNMPIEDALILITRNFDAYMRGDKSSNETLGSGGVMNVSDRHPTSVQLLLNLLAENRQITTSQYDKLLKYLQERREIQHQHEIEEGVDQDSQGSNSKQTELQNRIMNILNNKASTENIVSVTESVTQNEAPSPLLKDPSVQKALDSLLGGEMFKNVKMAH